MNDNEIVGDEIKSLAKAILSVIGCIAIGSVWVIAIAFANHYMKMGLGFLLIILAIKGFSDDSQP